MGPVYRLHWRQESKFGFPSFIRMAESRLQCSEGSPSEATIVEDVWKLRSNQGNLECHNELSRSDWHDIAFLCDVTGDVFKGVQAYFDVANTMLSSAGCYRTESEASCCKFFDCVSTSTWDQF